MKRVIFIIISIAAIGLFLIGMKPKISTLVSSFDKDSYVTFSGNGMNLLFDTGANITLLYTDTVPESFYPFIRTDATMIFRWRNIFRFMLVWGISKGICGQLSYCRNVSNGNTSMGL